MESERRKLLSDQQAALIRELDLVPVLFYLQTFQIFDRRTVTKIITAPKPLSRRRLDILREIGKRDGPAFDALYLALIFSDQQHLAALLRPLVSAEALTREANETNEAVERGNGPTYDALYRALIFSGQQDLAALLRPLVSAEVLTRDAQGGNETDDTVEEGNGRDGEAIDEQTDDVPNAGDVEEEAAMGSDSIDHFRAGDERNDDMPNAEETENETAIGTVFNDVDYDDFQAVDEQTDFVPNAEEKEEEAAIGNDVIYKFQAVDEKNDDVSNAEEKEENAAIESGIINFDKFQAADQDDEPNAEDKEEEAARENDIIDYLQAVDEKNDDVSNAEEKEENAAIESGIINFDKFQAADQDDEPNAEDKEEEAARENDIIDYLQAVDEKNDDVSNAEEKEENAAIESGIINFDKFQAADQEDEPNAEDKEEEAAMENDTIDKFQAVDEKNDDVPNAEEMEETAIGTVFTDVDYDDFQAVDQEKKDEMLNAEVKEEEAAIGNANDVDFDDFRAVDQTNDGTPSAGYEEEEEAATGTIFNDDDIDDIHAVDQTPNAEHEEDEAALGNALVDLFYDFHAFDQANDGLPFAEDMEEEAAMGNADNDVDFADFHAVDQNDDEMADAEETEEEAALTNRLNYLFDDSQAVDEQNDEIRNAEREEAAMGNAFIAFDDFAAADQKNDEPNAEEKEKEEATLETDITEFHRFFVVDPTSDELPKTEDEREDISAKGNTFNGADLTDISVPKKIQLTSKLANSKSSEADEQKPTPADAHVPKKIEATSKIAKLEINSKSSGAAEQKEKPVGVQGAIHKSPEKKAISLKPQNVVIGKKRSRQTSSKDQGVASVVKTKRARTVKNGSANGKISLPTRSVPLKPRSRRAVQRKAAGADDILDLVEVKVQIHHSELLGEGGFAKVFKASNVASGKTIAVKVLPNSAAGQKEMQMLKEIRNKGGLPNLVRLLGGCLLRGHFYLAMDLLGPSLLDILNDIVRLTVHQTASFMNQMMTALKFLHDINICHADVKPDNILTKSGIVRNEKGSIVDLKDPVFVLIDYNTAQKMAPGDLRKGVVGTTAYRAPEIVIGLNWTTQVDIFSLGLVVYECLDGELLIDFEIEDIDRLTPAERLKHLGHLEAAFGMLDETMLIESPIREIAAYGVNCKPENPGITKFQDKLLKLDDFELADDVYNLVVMMLTVNPKCRPTAKDLLKKISEKLKINGEDEEDLDLEDGREEEVEEMEVDLDKAEETVVIMEEDEEEHESGHEQKASDDALKEPKKEEGTGDAAEETMDHEGEEYSGEGVKETEERERLLEAVEGPVEEKDGAVIERMPKEKIDGICRASSGLDSPMKTAKQPREQKNVTLSGTRDPEMISGSSGSDDGASASKKMRVASRRFTP